ncbi:Zinc finger protein klf1 [Talaromyces islandicus]|uniref:Zinc finger protein klf1 n=1 Tax=Talaromyces islandicus TaxID=28573 RepID=A0A0U1M8X3_TALIS|nr:Zinc finger protein klf1 [Talaromyces islandicus]
MNEGTSSTPISVMSDTSVSANTKGGNDTRESIKATAKLWTTGVGVSPSISHTYLPNMVANPTEMAPFVNSEVTDQELVGYPYFFQQVMCSSPSQNITEIPTVYQPRGIFDFMHENDESCSPDNDVFWDDFLSDLDEICYPGPSKTAPDKNHDFTTEEERSASQRRAEAFRRSFWLWVERDNSVLRDLQYLQTEMLWLDMGVFCGYKRKMHIAEGSLQHLTTALRRAGAFERSSYSSISFTDSTADGENIENIWHQWVEQESLKRLVYHLFEHDHEVAMAINRPAITSYTELTLPFPAPRELWLAQTAHLWEQLWLEKYSDTGISDICPRDIIADPSLLSNLPLYADRHIVSTTLLHGLASQVCDFRRQLILTQYNTIKPRATVSLWLKSRQDDLYTVLRDLKDDFADLPALVDMFYQFTMLYLNINMDLIQRFVGKAGEVEARQAYFLLREWSQTQEARCAIWHAGQIFRSARQVPPYQLRGFDCIVTYHAALTLWVYSLLKCGERKHTVQPLPGDTDGPAAASSAIYLDQEENSLTRAFLAHGSGTPGVTILSTSEEDDGQSFQFCDLSHPRGIMAIALQIYENQTPLTMPGQNLPPLICNIRELVRDLGNLP